MTVLGAFEPSLVFLRTSQSMPSPTKRRKLNGDSKAPPVSARNLDYFFGKQRKEIAGELSDVVETSESQGDAAGLTDEEYARKLQAEWDQEVSGTSSPKNITVVAIESFTVPVLNRTTKSGGSPSDTGENFEATTTENYETKINGEGDGIEKDISDLPSRKAKNTLSLQSAGNTEDAVSSIIPFDESPLTFDPLKYVPDLRKHWAIEGGDASYALLTRCFTLVNSTQSRIKIVDTLVNLIRTIIEGDPGSLLPTVCIYLKLFALTNHVSVFMQQHSYHTATTTS
jgi:DNA ligase-1